MDGLAARARRPINVIPFEDYTPRELSNFLALTRSTGMSSAKTTLWRGGTSRESY